METITLNTPTATCGSCRARIREVMEEVTGVTDADLDVRTRQTTVVYDPAVIDQDRIAKLITEAGYPVQN
jgi:copper chaperone CopZ